MNSLNNKSRKKIKIGSKAQVYHGTANKTSGGLTKKQIYKDKYGRYKSLKKHQQMKIYKNNPLAKGGFLRKKNSKKFGPQNRDFNRNLNHRNKNKDSNFLTILKNIFD